MRVLGLLPQTMTITGLKNHCQRLAAFSQHLSVPVERVQQCLCSVSLVLQVSLSFACYVTDNSALHFAAFDYKSCCNLVHKQPFKYQITLYGMAKGFAHIIT